MILLIYYKLWLMIANDVFCFVFIENTNNSKTKKETETVCILTAIVPLSVRGNEKQNNAIKTILDNN